MAEAKQFHLKVTAGSSYDLHEEIHVNTNKSTIISTADADVAIQVQIKNFRASTSSTTSSSSEYFDQPSRSSARYSIRFSLVPKRNMSANALVFGNDFDEPIRHLLPPFFGTGLHFVKTWIDPGLDGDPQADTPWLYGPLISSVNVLRIGSKGKVDDLDGRKEEVLEEGASDDEANEIRKKMNLPDSGPKRQKYFLDVENRKAFEFEKGRIYDFDFFNGYLDFNEFSLILPMNLSFNIMRQLNTDEIQPLRYVLRDRDTDAVLFHVTFTLVADDSDNQRDSNPPKDEKRSTNTIKDDDVD